MRAGLILIYLLTAIGLSPCGSSTVHIYTQTIHRTTQNKQYIEQHDSFGRVPAVPRLGELYPGICLTTEERARKDHSAITLTPQKEASWMVKMKTPEDSHSTTCILLRPLITNNHSKALASSRDYHEVIITNSSVNMSRQMECNGKVYWKKNRNQSTDM